MKIPESILLPKLTQPCLVCRRDGLATGFGYERDEKSIELYTKLFLTRSLAIGHLVVHVAQEAITFHRRSPPLTGYATLKPVAVAVPSFTRRTALSAIPLVSER